MSRHTSPSQATQILAHLQTGARLTPLDARRLFKCDRLGARIHELKTHGQPIRSHLVPTPTGKHVAEYYLPDAPALPA